MNLRLTTLIESVRIWIAATRPDPEWALIRRLLDAAGEVVISADDNLEETSISTVYLVEVEGHAAVPALVEGAETVVVDHHRPGDPGYGLPPAEFMRASSLGQVIEHLAQMGRLSPDSSAWEEWSGETGRLFFTGSQWVVGQCGYHCPTPWYVPEEMVMAAAADHCLPAAYRGECPGVDPDALMGWRISSRAAHQGRPAEEILADVERAREALRSAPRLRLGEGPETEVADLRGLSVAELPEAACREGVAYLATPLPNPRDPRSKVVLGAAGEGPCLAWSEWAKREGLVDLYGGDPARGFAGGYLPD